MRTEVRCVHCPRSCRIAVEVRGASILSVRGNRCGRGEAYARRTVGHVEQVVIGKVRIAGCPTPLRLTTTGPIPQDRADDCIDAMRCAIPRLPVSAGDVIIADVLGLGVDVVALESVSRPH